MQNTLFSWRKTAMAMKSPVSFALNEAPLATFRLGVTRRVADAPCKIRIRNPICHWQDASGTRPRSYLRVCFLWGSYWCTAASLQAHAACLQCSSGCAWSWRVCVPPEVCQAWTRARSGSNTYTVCTETVAGANLQPDSRTLLPYSYLDPSMCPAAFQHYVGVPGGVCRG